MEKKQKKGNKTVIPAADSFTNHDHAGWMTKLFQDGWTWKRWRKRFCVLSNGTLYLYEQQTSKGTESGSLAIDLRKFTDCVKAPPKESKKYPNTLILEPVEAKDNNNKKNGKDPNHVSREFFSTNEAAELEKWIARLKESISLSCGATNAKLQHVTKTRARPPRSGGGNRRPPSKQHLKERAEMSEVSMETTESKKEKDDKNNRVRLPQVALKPMGKPRLRSVAEKQNGIEAEKKDADASDGSSPPVTPVELKENGTTADQKEKQPPRAPPVALKPSLKSTKSEEVDESDNLEAGENISASPDTSDEPTNASNAQEDSEEPPVDDKKAKPPPLPPASMKPPSIKDTRPENDEDDEPENDENDEPESVQELEQSASEPEATSVEPTTPNAPEDQEITSPPGRKQSASPAINGKVILRSKSLTSLGRSANNLRTDEKRPRKARSLTLST